MELADLKIKIIEEITSSMDKDLLNDVLKMLHEDSEDSTFSFSEKGRGFIQKGLDDYRDGKTLSNEEANQIFQQWTKK